MFSSSSLKGRLTSTLQAKRVSTRGDGGRRVGLSALGRNCPGTDILEHSSYV